MGNDFSLERPERVNKLLPHVNHDVREYILDLEQMVINIQSDPDGREIQRLKSQNEHYINEINRLTHYLEANGQDKACVNSLQDEVRRLKQENLNIQKTYDTFQENSNHLMNEMEQEIDRVRKERNSLQDQIDSMEMNNSLAKVAISPTDQVHPLDNHYKELDAKYLDMQEELFGMQVQTHELKTLLKQTTDDNNRLRRKNSQLEEKLTRLNKCSEARVHDSTTRTAGSTPHDESEAQIDSEDTVENAHSVLLKGFPQHLVGDDIMENIEIIATVMELTITAKDIKKITPKGSISQSSGKNNLIVDFINQQIKMDLLKHKERLKNFDIFKDIEICDYVSEDVYKLFQYAKILKYHGYQSVYWRNNCVYAKKTHSPNSQEIRIESGEHVDSLRTNN